jgi:hypothetical protein
MQIQVLRFVHAFNAWGCVLATARLTTSRYCNSHKRLLSVAHFAHRWMYAGHSAFDNKQAQSTGRSKIGMNSRAEQVHDNVCRLWIFCHNCVKYLS